MRYITLLLALVISVFSYADEQGKVKFDLPINWSFTPHVDLVVEMPVGYASLQEFDSWEKAPLIEFVPKGENGESWNEIITIHKLINRKIRASNLVTLSKISMLADLKHAKVIEESSEELPGYQKASLFISYDLNGNREILGLEYFSGPFDCIGVQYTIRNEKRRQRSLR